MPEISFGSLLLFHRHAAKRAKLVGHAEQATLGADEGNSKDSRIRIEIVEDLVAIMVWPVPPHDRYLRIIAPMAESIVRKPASLPQFVAASNAALFAGATHMTAYQKVLLPE